LQKEKQFYKKVVLLGTRMQRICRMGKDRELWWIKRKRKRKNNERIQPT